MQKEYKEVDAMDYEEKIENGKKIGCMTFSTGKKLFLNEQEIEELFKLVDLWNWNYYQEKVTTKE